MATVRDAEETNDRNADKVVIYDLLPSDTQPVEYSLTALPTNVRRLSSPDTDTSVRWIHIPDNDTAIVTNWVRRLIDDSAAEALISKFEQGARPPSCIRIRNIPNHARFMEPSFQLHDGAEPGQAAPDQAFQSCSLYLPYLNWELFSHVPKSGQDIPPSRHPRRTLDQFFYSGLRNTDSRDGGQTVSKWTGTNPEPDEKGRKTAIDSSYVIMVDQLWLWVINEKTVVSCSPRVTRFTELKFKDFIESISSSELAECADPLDLTTLLVMRSVTNVFTGPNKDFADIVAICRWAITIKAADHTQKLEDFSRKQSSTARDRLATEGAEELSLTLEVADILDELNILLLLLETQARVLASLEQRLMQIKPAAREPDPDTGNVITIRDSSVQGEMRISTSGGSRDVVAMSDTTVGSLYITNENHAPTAARTISGMAGHWLQQALQGLNSEKYSLERLRSDATRTHELLNQLLDLQQKAASLTEARVATTQARVATTQGKAVMLFTIVTIVFLPLSFFTSYFGQNVSELTGDDKNPSSAELWKIAGPISVVVILFALLVAYFIMYPSMRKDQDSDQVTEPA